MLHFLPVIFFLATYIFILLSKFIVKKVFYFASCAENIVVIK